jgi:hypothetical protein
LLVRNRYRGTSLIRIRYMGASLMRKLKQGNCGNGPNVVVAERGKHEALQGYLTSKKTHAPRTLP